MPRKITNQRAGEDQDISASFVNKVANFINNFTVVGGTFKFDGYKAKLTIPRIATNGANVRAVPCVTTGAPTDGIYPVAFHEDGKNEASTGTGELELLSVHIGEVLPTGTWVIGFPATVRVTGGS